MIMVRLASHASIEFEDADTFAVDSNGDLTLTATGVTRDPPVVVAIVARGMWICVRQHERSSA